MSALPRPGAATLVLSLMTPADLGAVLAIETVAYEFPWTRGNFVDSLAAGYRARLLHASGDRSAPAGYYLAMEGVDELHLLNLTVAPAWRRHGMALRLLDDLVDYGRDRALHQLWLEVRESNRRAQTIYRRYGLAPIGKRRGYYPAPRDTREDAIVMGMALDALD
jgi:[ribosomal protein S18]-alanine N-acetyltransferase